MKFYKHFDQLVTVEGEKATVVHNAFPYLGQELFAMECDVHPNLEVNAVEIPDQDHCSQKTLDQILAAVGQKAATAKKGKKK